MKEIVDIVKEQFPIFLELQKIIGDIIETVKQMTDTPEKKIIASLTTFIAIWKAFSEIRKKIDRRRKP